MSNLSSDREPSDAYVGERRRVVRQRLRWTALLALVPISGAAVVNALVFSDRLGEHLATLALQGTFCLLGAAVSFHRSSRRWAVGCTVVMVLAIAAVQLWATALVAPDVDVLVVPIVVLMMATTVLFPWGVGPQAVVAASVAASYLLLPYWSDLDSMRITNILIGVSTGAGISVYGAFVLDRQRRATFVERERVAALAHQRELLLDAGRELNSVIDLDQLVALITRLAQRVVDCDIATLTLLGDTIRDRHRVIAVARDQVDVTEHDLVKRANLGFRAALIERGTIELPGDGEFDERWEDVDTLGLRRFLVVAVQRHGRLLAVLALGQHAPEPRFSEQSIRLAEGIAHQAAIALANARLVDDLQRANRVKSEFVSTMSHELRTPLNVILGFAEMGRDPTLSAAERLECLGKIDLAGRELLDLIESTLAIGKLEAGRDAPMPEPVALAEFWTALGAACDRMPRHPSVALEWAAAPPLSVRTDPRKLTVVLRNLVSNALKFTETGRVSVRVAASGGMLAFAVTDTGIGIRPEHQGTVFEMFRQADGSDSRRFGGSGLGLYIVQRYVAQLGGTVTLDSALGRGSTFTVQLPLASAAARQAA